MSPSEKDLPSLEECFPEIPTKILYADGLKPLFYLMRNARHSVSSAIMYMIEDVLSSLSVLLDESDSIDINHVKDILYPLAEAAMGSENRDEQKNGVWALALLIRDGYTPSGSFSTLLEWLRSSDEEYLGWAAMIFRNLTWVEKDISLYIEDLETLLSHESYHIRLDAATAISNELCRSGMEPAIEVHEAVFADKMYDHYWQIDVHYRRHHARSDNPLATPEYTAHFRAERTCGSCGYGHAKCIFYYDDSGTGWIDRTSEYKCPECGKYTVYRYVD